MIHLVTHANRQRYALQIEQMFRLRHDFYVKERGWRELERADGREIDDYDDEDAVYLLHLDEAGEVDGSYRIRPTAHNSLLADKFRHLVADGEPPAGQQIWEITRFFLSPQARRAVGALRSAVSAELTAGLIEAAVRRRLTHYTLVCDTFFLPRLHALRWPFTHLGLPHDYREGTAMAVLIEAGPHVLEITRATMGLKRPITFEAAPVLRSDDYRISACEEIAALERLAPAPVPVTAQRTKEPAEPGSRDPGSRETGRRDRTAPIVVDVMMNKAL